MHPCVKYFLAVFGGLMLGAVPALAGRSTMHTDSMPYDITQAVTVGTAHLQPGNYVIQGKESQPQLDILQHDKVVATVPCEWIQLNTKAKHSEVIASKNQVTEIEFEGRTEAVKIG